MSNRHFQNQTPLEMRKKYFVAVNVVVWWMREIGTIQWTATFIQLDCGRLSPFTNIGMMMEMEIDFRYSMLTSVF